MRKDEQFNIDNCHLKGTGSYETQGMMEDKLIREQPYYRYGMTKEEAAREDEYMKLCIDVDPMSFYEGKYTPLWKQNLYR